MPLPMLAESGGRMPFRVWTLASLIWPRTTASAPALFGNGFAKKAKERDEELKCLNQVTKTSLHPTRATFLEEVTLRGTDPSTVGVARTTTGGEEEASKGKDLIKRTGEDQRQRTKNSCSKDYFDRLHKLKTYLYSNLYTRTNKIFTNPYTIPNNRESYTDRDNSNGSKSLRETNPHSRENTIIPGQLEGYYKRPITRLCNRPNRTPLPKPNSKGTTFLTRGITNPLGGSGKNDRETGNINSSQGTNGKGFSIQLFIVPKKDGGVRPIINLKRLNTFVETVHFRMEGIHNLRDT